MTAVRDVVYGKTARGDTALVMTTCLRPERYLERTLIALEHAGLSAWRGPRLMIADGYDPRDHFPLVATQGWEVHCSRTREGLNPTIKRAWRLACAQGVDAILHIEDDVVFARGALVYMARVVWPKDACAIAWFTKYAPPCERGHYWHVRPMREYARLQAISFYCDRLRDDRVVNYSATRGIENVFGLAWPDDPCYIHYPNLVQHIGMKSSYMEQGVQVSGWFAGEHFDARSWLP